MNSFSLLIKTGLPGRFIYLLSTVGILKVPLLFNEIENPVNQFVRTSNDGDVKRLSFSVFCHKTLLAS